MNKRTIRAIFATCRVEAKSLQDFYERYYRHDRYGGRGDDYVACVLDSGRDDLLRHRVTAVSSKDSLTGHTVAWGPK